MNKLTAADALEQARALHLDLANTTQALIVEWEKKPSLDLHGRMNEWADCTQLVGFAVLHLEDLVIADGGRP